MTGRLKGKVAIVFGAGSIGPGWGNGKATAVAYAREGARVYAVDRNPAAAEETVGIIRAENGAAESMVADVTDSDAVARAVDGCIGRFGRIDILHNNVGMASIGGPVEMSETVWDASMRLNIGSLFLTCKHVLPIMEAQNAGAIVNVSSIASIRWLGSAYISYSASKAAVNQFTQAIALQYARKGIRANAILPGMMHTPHIHQAIAGQYASAEEMIAARDASTPMGRQGTGWDVARAAAFLASDEADYITGQCLAVDGGQSVRC